MACTKLKEDLENCLITFDRRVLLTELLDDYDLPYEEVNQVVTNHLKQQENKGEIKYEKRYVVHGVQEGEHKKEIYKVVAETNLKEWLKKLKNAESSLYSVEVVGGAKAAADIFRPMKVNKNVKIKDRTGVKATTSNGDSAASVNTFEKKPIKVETKNPFQEASTSKRIAKSPAKAKTPTKSVSPKTVSPPDKNSATKKGGINNFFAPATQKKADTETKSNKSVVKPPTPKKMQDYFKKQTEKPKALSKESSKNNTSVQLFDSEDEEEKEDPEEVSSDEEEKIEALKRDIISSDVEMDEDTEETDNKPSTSSKRRRILDSDDESEDPPIKQEKLDIKEEFKEEEDEKVEEPETYLDEEGFVITKKPKQKASTHKVAPAIKTTPPVTMKTSPKESKKITPTGSKDNKKSGNPTAKTKQAGIMSFFAKK